MRQPPTRSETIVVQFLPTRMLQCQHAIPRTVSPMNLANFVLHLYIVSSFVWLDAWNKYWRNC